eukprot:GHVS01104117.1.p3 GENE.GHVS01104117.1~~GHVS01104117.1.p3  ORF type:complete len:152 (+),score=38.91 GHVS01104117.1:696-1151(+)
MNVGLGHEFLRHIERTTVLVYVVDVANSPRPPLDVFACLRNEVLSYSKDLAAKPFIIAATKCDIRPESSLPNVDKLWRSVTQQQAAVEVVAVSCRYGDGVSNLVQQLRRVVDMAVADRQRQTDGAGGDEQQGESCVEEESPMLHVADTTGV